MSVLRCACSSPDRPCAACASRTTGSISAGLCPRRHARLSQRLRRPRPALSTRARSRHGLVCKIAEYLTCRRPLAATATPNLLTNFPRRGTNSPAVRPVPATSTTRAGHRLAARPPLLATPPIDATWARIAARARRWPAARRRASTSAYYAVRPQAARPLRECPHERLRNLPHTVLRHPGRHHPRRHARLQDLR